MDFTERLRSRAEWIRLGRPERLAPTASVRRDVVAGGWSEGSPLERLARLARAAGAALGEAPALAGSYDGRKGLRLARSAHLVVGLQGGRRYQTVPATGGSEAELVAALERATDGARARPPAGGLELLDLSELEVQDWRGTLASPRVARLVLLAPAWQLAAADAVSQAFGLVLDFDQRLVDAGQACDFLVTVAGGLLGAMDA